MSGVWDSTFCSFQNLENIYKLMKQKRNLLTRSNEKEKENRKWLKWLLWQESKLMNTWTQGQHIPRYGTKCWLVEPATIRSLGMLEPATVKLLLVYVIFFIFFVCFCSILYTHYYWKTSNIISTENTDKFFSLFFVSMYFRFFFFVF